MGRAVLIRPFEPEITQGKIVIPDHVKEGHKMKEVRGVVVAVGPEAWREERQPRAVPGDVVLVSQWSGVVLVGPKDKEWYRMVNGDDVYCGVTHVEDLAFQTPTPHSMQRKDAAKLLQGDAA